MNAPTSPHPVELLQTLVRFNTTNPPGDEAEAIRTVAGLLRAAGLPVDVVGRNERRLNLIARLKGRGEAPPLMLEAHMDVVSTEDQTWTHPPFSGEIADGMIWGRGTLDDKGAVAVMTSAVLRAHAEGYRPPGDVLLVIVADEEVSGEYGAQYLVKEHAERFADVRYAIGEGGGYAVRMGGQKFYPIMVAEKHGCAVRVIIRGESGHGAVPVRGEAMAKLADVLRTLDRRRAPVHVTPVARQMLNVIARTLPFPQGAVIGALRTPMLANPVLDLLGDKGKQLDPLLHNTFSPTMVRGGKKINVIPGELTLDLDGRLLPGYDRDDALRELRGLLGDGVELEVLHYAPDTPAADLARYETLAALIREADPVGTPMPFMVGGATDARHFAKLGIQMYGFVPFDLPDGLLDTIHAADERVPVAAVEQGADIMFQVLKRFWPDGQ